MTALRRERLPAEASLVRPGALWGLVLSGAVTLETAGDRRTILPGDAVLVDPRTAHRLTADVETDLVHGDLRRSVTSTPLPSPLVQRRFGKEHRGIVALVTTCPLSVQCRVDRFASAYAGLIGAAISSLSPPPERAGDQGAVRGPADDPQVAEVVAALAARPGEPWNLDRMAALVHLSRSALTDRFRRATGHSPMRMLREVRMHRARLLLTKQCLAVTRVAFEVGYGSVAAFSRAFAADHGVSPLAWRAIPRASVARYPQERPAEPRRHRRSSPDQQQRPDAVPVQ
ncbi:AraC-type DNA-binding protein [Promicromonospora umidemergens]|uniref:HTH araC/xylS-type domain-containing protein n=1 Tax=Promicromonospora umidemergens TaxID=629679 RepID=A0ABP8Y7W0_9MICO|nr:AraC family transcriptional regulator [Promicromonospora umidemergens]MCP2282368.1 AraC-type DNA-binding protein [Promicromonospora umidemergens]